MTLNEKAELTIEPEWAYGRKGKPEAKYPFYMYFHYIIGFLMSKIPVCFPHLT